MSDTGTIAPTCSEWSSMGSLCPEGRTVNRRLCRLVGLLQCRRREADVVPLVRDDLEWVVGVLVQVAVGVDREGDDARAHEREPLDGALEVAEDVAGLPVVDHGV